jgi:hypothetical protein
MEPANRCCSLKAGNIGKGGTERGLKPATTKARVFVVAGFSPHSVPESLLPCIFSDVLDNVLSGSSWLKDG